MMAFLKRAGKRALRKRAGKRARRKRAGKQARTQTALVRVIMIMLMFIIRCQASSRPRSLAVV